MDFKEQLKLKLSTAISESAVASILTDKGKNQMLKMMAGQKFHTQIRDKNGTRHEKGVYDSNGNKVIHKVWTESWDWESELKSAGDAADKKLGKKTKVVRGDEDEPALKRGLSNKEKGQIANFTQPTKGRVVKGTYGTSHQEPDDEEEEVKPVKAAGTRTSKKAAEADQAKKFSSSGLSDVLGIRMNRQLATLKTKKNTRPIIQKDVESPEDKAIGNDPKYDIPPKRKLVGEDTIEEMALSAEKIGDLGFKIKWAGGKGKDKGTYFSKVHPANKAFDPSKHLQRVSN